MKRRDPVLLQAIDGMGRRFDAVDQRLDHVNERLDRTNARIDTVIDVLAELRADVTIHTGTHRHDDD